MRLQLFLVGALLALALYGASARLPIPELSKLAKAGKLEATPVVTTVNGQVSGVVDDEVFLYLGIPFAAPPTGENRFKSPQPPQNWTGVRDASSFGNICVQYPKVLGIHLGAEDCLFVNVYTPADAIERAAAGNPYPVMFWIYGGAYVLGDGYEFGLYDARNIVAKRGVIVVTHNYRLGVLGFMAHDALRAEDPDNSTGSYGVQDQRAALQWVQANIASFGGNPDAVTIYGESAGAFSVCYHLASAASGGLFSAAIMESGNCDSSDFFQPYELAASFGDIYADACGCDSRKMTPPEFLSCIRGLSVGDLLKDITTWLNPDWPYPLIEPAQKEFAQKAALRRGLHQAHHEHRQHVARGGVGRDPYVPLLSPAMPWGIAIDGTTKGLKGRPIDLLPDTVNDVPLIIGTNMNEGSIFILLLPLVVPGGTFPINDKTLNLTLSLFFNSSVAEEAMTTIYPSSGYKDDDHRAGIILRDFFFVCPTRRAARALYENKDTATFVYQFLYHEDWPETPILGDYHSSELEFVFDNEWPPILHTFSANDTIIADTFNTYWTNHAKFHDPNGNSVSPGPAVWPEYNTTDEVNLAIDIPLAYEYDLIGSRCDFWDRVGDHVPSRVFKRRD